MGNLDAFLAPLIGAIEPAGAVKRGPRPKAENAKSTKYVRRHRETKLIEKKRYVAVLDMETDPFDNVQQSRIFPFVACLYSDEFEPVVIWDEDNDRFIDKVISAIERLDGEYTIYAHNGGKFDYMFLIYKLRGTVSFKGRGIMSAKVGRHTLRDSFHIIPEKLAAIQKETFDYEKMHKGRRNDHRAEIIEYLISDCCYLLGVIQQFLDRFGFKLSIGQAAMFELKKDYDVKKFTKNWDAYIRNYFYGGRVECLQGRGHWKADKKSGPFKLYDVNSMYPYVMATYDHPVGAFPQYQIRIGKPNANTVFIRLTCENRGALVSRTSEGSACTMAKGEFLTTIWEYEVAMKYNLIRNVKIKFCIDCSERSNFSKTILPLYAKKEDAKKELDRMKSIGRDSGEAFVSLKRDYIFYKLLQNNLFGKFAQNPRNFKEHFLTDPGAMPPDEYWQSLALSVPNQDWERDEETGKITNPPENWYKHFMGAIKADETIASDYDDSVLPHYEGERYWIWRKPSPGFRFNNVGTAASITGASRAVLLEAIQLADTPIYCDTDGLICRNLEGVEIDKSKLGAWDIEDEFSEVIICGKKTYGCKTVAKPGLEPQIKIRSKGINRDPKSGGLDWKALERMLKGESVSITNNAPTLNKFGKQFYVTRRVKATAPIKRRESVNARSQSG